MTSPTETLPPPELRGLAGQLGDAGGMTPRDPSPSIAHGSPGLATGAATIPHAPTLPSDDPASMAVMIAQMANEMFLGSSIVPVPLAPNAVALAASQSSSLGAPGVSSGMPGGIPALPTGDVLAVPPLSPISPTSSPSTTLPSPGGSPMADTTPTPGAFAAGSIPIDAPPASPFMLDLSFTSMMLEPPPATSISLLPDPTTPSDAPPVPAPTASPTWEALPATGTPPSTAAGTPPTAAPDFGAFGSSPTPPSLPTFEGSPFSTPSIVGEAGIIDRSAFTPPSVPGLVAPTSPLGTSSPPVAPPAGTATPMRAVPTTLRAAPTDPISPTFIPDAPAPFTSVANPATSPTTIGDADGFTPTGAPTSGSVVSSDAKQRVPGVFDPYVVRKDFPILDERVHDNKRLVWLDNAATTQKPRAVIDRLAYFYAHENSNIHRAAHTLAARATDAYENARESVRRFLNASSTGEIIFVRGATEGINLIAQAWGRRNISAGDEIVVSHLEHHANIVPWQQLCAQTGAKLRVAPVDDDGEIILEEYEKVLSSRTKLVSFTQVSNALGSITPAREMVAIARRYGATVVVDGAQTVSHMRVDVQALDCDFYVFSGHKVFGPTGIGAVYGKRAVLDAMPPWQGGGNMIADVTFESTKYQPPPFRFEAGTGNIADAVGLGAALDYVMRIGMDVIDRYEHELVVYATGLLLRVPGLRMLGPKGLNPHKAGVLSFVLDGQRTEDVGGILDKDGIAVRSGHHCAQPILRRLGVEASVRASLAFYNVREDIDALVAALHKLQRAR
ncbi:MAG: family 2A encapsulin nanocompartment cargo protein cysteine desulfurase [Proteobacteria bacterium]|nr:family 2A encapsulin nanocompartment cargo protein cysteine desulfurase [Pseudomonadota bacterium]